MLYQLNSRQRHCLEQNEPFGDTSVTPRILAGSQIAGYLKGSHCPPIHKTISHRGRIYQLQNPSANFLDASLMCWPRSLRDCSRSLEYQGGEVLRGTEEGEGQSWWMAPSGSQDKNIYVLSRALRTALLTKLCLLYSINLLATTSSQRCEERLWKCDTKERKGQRHTSVIGGQL